ncbi:phage minor tail protein L [Xenorhabdus innexi]|uniref:Minor tail protein L n=1 Tax=Xenorhabdus innexi TaxID=290109 RepID=A0A1N6N1U5_9GAMM|nr:phage minor tail protein L [Xenorhabdus innexi]PHM37200.1 putative tail component of prophage [Xenorhabdus innexi]SIP75019.1 Minor tail protein L [Xenorhabdus innexi]
MRDIPQDMRIAVTELGQAAILNLYEIDLTAFGGDIYRFHDGMNGRLQPVIWQGVRYEAYPVEVSGFEMNGKGPSARPKMVFANINGLMTAINQDFHDALGAVVTRHQVPEQYLDAVNFLNGNPQADPTREAVSKYLIEQKQEANADFVTYLLALPSETDGALIPARVIQADICCWQYRSADCGYDGPPVADEKDQSTSNPLQDRCSKKYSGCVIRFPRPLSMPYGGFLGANKLG